MKQTIFFRYLLIVLCIVSMTTTVYSMETTLDNKYNAFTLFGDSEPLGRLTQRISQTARKLADIDQTRQEEIQKLQRTVAEASIAFGASKDPRQKELLRHKHALFKCIIEYKKRSFDAKERYLKPCEPLPSRQEIVKKLRAEQEQVLAIYKTYQRTNNTDLKDSKLLTMVLERELLVYDFLTQCNMPENICVFIDYDKDAWDAESVTRYGNKVVMLNSDPDLATAGIATKALHEIAHHHYGDNRLNLYTNSPFIGLAQITAPFLGYAVARHSIARNPGIAGLYLGIEAAAAYFFGIEALVTYGSRYRELRADSFAHTFLAQHKSAGNTMATVYFIFNELHREEPSTQRFKSITALYDTHPRPVTRALNAISILEHHGIPFDKNLINSFTAQYSQQYTDYSHMLMHKHLPKELLLKAGIEPEQVA